MRFGEADSTQEGMRNTYKIVVVNLRERKQIAVSCEVKGRVLW